MSKSVKRQVHEQIVGALKGAKFPLRTVEELIASFPEGENTTCRVGDLNVTAGEAALLLVQADFPFKSAKAVADLIVERAGI